jgi:hypothetical protein
MSFEIAHVIVVSDNRENAKLLARGVLYLYPYEVLLTWRCSITFQAIELYSP